MGRGSSIPEDERNELHKARDRAGLSREEVERLTNGQISHDRLNRIELGKSEIRAEDVITLSEVYNEPELCNVYCSTICPIGKRYVPKIEVEDISRIILKMESALNAANHRREELVEIASDGEVSESEMKALSRIQADLERLSISVEALQLWVEKNA